MADKFDIPLHQLMLPFAEAHDALYAAYKNDEGIDKLRTLLKSNKNALDAQYSDVYPLAEAINNILRQETCDSRPNPNELGFIAFNMGKMLKVIKEECGEEKLYELLGQESKLFMDQKDDKYSAVSIIENSPLIESMKTDEILGDYFYAPSKKKFMNLVTHTRELSGRKIT